MPRTPCLVAALLLCTHAVALAQSSPPTDPAAITFESRPKIEFGFEERIRSEAWDNIIDHRSATDDFRTQYRFRTRVWASLKFGSRLEVVTGLNNENRKITEPDMAYNGREIIFETLYADVRLTPAWSVRVGRQNIMRGEGFIIFDGNALDGSRTAYFNALNVTRSFARSRLELLAISNPSTDQYLPRLNEATDPAELQRLTEWDERALGVYLTSTLSPRTALDAYYFHKTETDDDRPVSHPQYQPDRRLDAIGGRVVHTLGRGFTLAAEAAYELGSQDAAPGSTGPSREIRAWGAYTRLKREFSSPAKPSLSLAYIGMSGDDPATSAIEGWDPLFSRWPRWSELYIYTYAPEAGVAYWTNTGMWEAEVRANPWKPLNLRATYYRMAAYESWAAKGARYGPGSTRGDLFQIRADLAFGPSWKGHILYEHLNPASFYSGDDSGYFLRFEVIYTFKKSD